MIANVNPRPGHIVRYGVLGLLVLFAIITVFNLFVTINSGYIGVVTTFGKVTGEMQPGLHWKLPYVQSVTRMNVQVQKDQTDETAATNDLQTVTSTVALNYHLDHGQVDSIFVNLSPDYADRVISPTISEVVKGVTAKYTASELLTRRPEVAKGIQDLLISRLQPRGILVDQFSIVDFKFSDQFSQAIEAKQAAQQDAERAQFNLQKAQLDGQANQAQTSALTESILEQQAIAKWNGVLPQFVGQGSVFNIPLNK